MRLAILRVHKDEQAYNRFWESLMRMNISGAEIVFHSSVEGQVVHKARNEVVRLALQEPTWDMSMFVDDDMIYPPDTVERAMATLAKCPDIKILSGLYFEKRFPHTPHVYEEALEPEYKNKYWPIVDYDQRVGSDGLLKVDATGAGILFVRREVFEKIKEPWFLFLDKLGEDFYFCRKAHTAGYDIWCDVNMKATHCGIAEIHEGIFQQIRPHLKKSFPISGDKSPSQEAYVVEG